MERDETCRTRSMVKSIYIPERGDLIWLNLDPTVGHEQSGLRPALVLTPKLYHERSGIALVCPATSVFKNYPFQLPLPTLKKNPRLCFSGSNQKPRFSSPRIHIHRKNSPFLHEKSSGAFALFGCSGLAPFDFL